MEWITYKLRDGLEWENSQSSHRFMTGEQRVKLGAFGMHFNKHDFDVLFELFAVEKYKEAVVPRGKIRARRVDDFDVDEVEVRLAGNSTGGIMLSTRDFLILFEEDRA